MVKLIITENEENQRLDRFLKKYFKNAPLGYIYKLIRKKVRVNGKRVSIDTFLRVNDEIHIFIDPNEVEVYRAKKIVKVQKKQFHIAYEDEHLLVVEKPSGLLVHGGGAGESCTLVNQVYGYLVEKGEFCPEKEKTFMPSPVNRLDRNTSGLIIFAKDNQSLQNLNKMIRERGYIRKFYLTIVSGKMREEIHLVDKLEKDRGKNQVIVRNIEGKKGKAIETIARPIIISDECALVEVELVTGRTHQIRAHLSSAGFPIIGDAKYGDYSVNKRIKKEYGLTTQFLHAYRIYFVDGIGPIAYMRGKEVKSQLPPNLEAIRTSLFG